MSLKQSPINPAALPSGKEHLPDCWHHERDRHCLRIELNSGEVFLFRYQQFFGVHHVNSTDPETLKISFSTHEVILSGRSLSEIATALGDLAVQWIKVCPSRYQRVAEMDRALVFNIQIRAVE